MYYPGLPHCFPITCLYRFHDEYEHTLYSQASFQGAEAIFLHLIHPLVRPYVPAVDHILATLHSVSELVSLILFLPLEYVLHWWHRWGWNRFWSSNKDRSNSEECLPDREDKEEIRRRLRPRNELRQGRMREADRQAQVILQEIEDAQDRVRTRTENQPTAWNNVRTEPIHETRDTVSNVAGLRTRKRVLDRLNGLPGGVNQSPGSRSTGVHHLDPTTITQLARGPTPQLPFPDTPTVQPITCPSPPMRILTPSSSGQSSHEIWYPPQTAFEARKNQSPSPESARRTPSPIYPPLPSAYRFTPRRSDPQPPHIMTPSDLATPVPRRVSTGGMSRGAVNAYEGIDQFPGGTSQASPPASTPLTDALLHVHDSHAHSRSVSMESFRQALEPSIQTTDVDMETLSTRDGSSVNEESMEGEVEVRLALHDVADASVTATVTRGKRGSSREPSSGITRRSHKSIAPTRPVRRSERTRRDRSSSVETDEFGFTIRQDSTPLEGLTTDSSLMSSFGSGSLAPGQSKKKPLARTKPALKSTQEEAYQSDSNDEESVKKRRKLRPDIEGQPRPSARDKHQLKVSSLGDDIGPKARDDAREKTIAQGTMQSSHSPGGVLKDRQVGTRVTRASTRQPQSRPNVTKRGRGK